MKGSAPVLQKILLLFAILILLLCPLVFFSSMFYPKAVAFLEPLICPAGLHLDRVADSISDPRGNATAVYVTCTDGRQQVDVTGKMLIILVGIGILGVGLLITWALTSPGKASEIPKIKTESD